MPMIDLSIGFDEANGDDPAGMCVLYRDKNGEGHIQNLISGDKAALIYRLLTTPSTDYTMEYRRVDFDCHDKVDITFYTEGGN